LRKLFSKAALKKSPGQGGRPALITQRKNPTAGSDQTSKQTEALLARLVSAAERGNPDEAEHLSKQLSDHLTAARLPCDLLREKLAIARHLQMEAAMKATELALDRAFTHLLAKQTLEHARDLAWARNHLGKAALLGAPREFRQRCERRIETIILSARPGANMSFAERQMAL
jgi:hypothetical protein